MEKINRIKLAYQKGFRVLRDGTTINKKRKKLSPCLDGRNPGYYTSAFRYNKKHMYFKIHRLQAYQKYGDKMFEPGTVVRHKNGNSMDNSWDNILIGTHKENSQDIKKQIRLALSLYASSFMQKYKHSEVQEFYNSCKSYKKTMNHFNISSKGTLFYILKKSFNLKTK